MNKKYGTLVGIFLLFSGLLLLGFYALESDYIEAKLASFAKENIEKSLHLKIDLQKIKLKSLQNLEVEGLIIYDKEEKPFVKVKKGNISYDPFLIFKKDKLSLISAIDIEKSEIFVHRRPSKEWNYEDLLSKDKEESNFLGKIKVSDLTFHVSYQKEASAPLKKQSEHNITLEDIKGEIDFSNAKNISLNLEGTSKKSPLKLYGTVGKEENPTSLHLEGENLTLSNYFSHLPLEKLPKDIEILDGKVDKIDLNLKKQKNALQYSGTLSLNEAALILKGKKIQDIKGEVNFTSEKIALDLEGYLLKEKLSLKGQVLLNTKDNVPYLDLTLQANAFTPKHFFDDLPFAGQTEMLIYFSEQAVNPKIEAKLKAKSGKLFDHFVQNAKLHLLYLDEVFKLKDFNFDIFNGNIQGECIYQKGMWQGKVQLHNLSLVDVKPYVNLENKDLEGEISGTLAFKKQEQNVDFSGTLAGQNICYNDEFLPHIETSFAKKGKNLTLHALKIDFLDNGHLELQGTMHNQKLDFNFKGQNLPLQILRKIDPRLQVSGKADAQGQIQGDISKPNIKVDISATKGKILEQPYDYLEGAFSGNLDAVEVDKFFMEKDGKKNWLLQGFVGFTGEKKLHLQIDTIGARMEDIKKIAFPKQNITGNVDNIITITGTLDNPQAVGYIHFYIGSYEGTLLTGMDGDYDLKDGVMTLHDFHIYAPLIDMDLNGTLTRTFALNLDVQAHDVDFKRFSHLLPYPVSGHGKFTGKIGGYLQNPTFAGKLSADKLIFNSAILANAHGNLTYQDKSLTLYDFGFTQEEGTYRMDANVNLAKNTLRGMLEVEKGQLHTLLSFLDLKNDNISGKIQGKLLLYGMIDNPRADLNLYLSEGNIFSYPLTDVRLLASLMDKRLILKKFTGTQGKGSFMAKGNFDFQGELDGEANFSGLEAGIFANLANIKADIFGTLDMDAQIKGSLQKPKVLAKLTAKNLGVNSFPFDDVHALMHYEDDIFSLDELVIAKNMEEKTAKITVKGYIPFNILAKEKNSSKDMYFKFDFDEADLGLFSAILPFVEEGKGKIKGLISLRGNIKEPSLTGDLSLVDGEIKIKYLKKPLTHMQAAIKFLGDKIELLHFTGKMGQGTYKIAGESRLEEAVPKEYKLQMELKDLEVESKYYKGPFTATLNITEEERFSQKMPLLAGYIPFHSTTFALPSLGEEQTTLPLVALDLDFFLGDKVRFYNPLLYDVKLTGDVYLGGTTLHPRTQGTIYSPRGSIRYLKNRFKIIEGEAYFNQFDSFLPTINLKTKTNVGSIKVDMNIEGPAQALNIRLTSSPSLSNEEILRLLTFRHNYEEKNMGFDEEVSSMLKAGLKMSILGEVEGAVQDFLKLDEFTISEEFSTKNKRAPSSHEVYSIGIGKYISDKVMLNYKKTFGTDEYKYGVRYDFDKRFSMFLTRNEERAYNVGLEARFRF